MNFNLSCISSRISLDLPHQIWEALSSDPPNQILLTRLFHNKIFFLASNYLRCYLSYFSPDFITEAFSIVGLVLFLVGLYFLVERKKRRFLILVLIAPLFPLFEFPAVTFVRGVIIYAAIISVMAYGVLSLVKKKWQ